jgi:hypothetical protein
MMDISDGLVLDATRMATASGVVMRLDTKLAGDKDALFGGEDHGLLATFPPTVTPPEGFVVIGVVEAPTTAPEVLIEGVDLTLRELTNVMTKHGVQPISPAPGDQFDPQQHQAMFEAPVPGTKAGQIIQVMTEGFMLHDRLLRPAQVGVSSTPG